MIEPASLGAAGRTVRCSRCKTTWFAAAPAAAAAARRSSRKPIAEAGGRAGRAPQPAPDAAHAAPAISAMSRTRRSATCRKHDAAAMPPSTAPHDRGRRRRRWCRRPAMSRCRAMPPRSSRGRGRRHRKLRGAARAAAGTAPATGANLALGRALPGPVRLQCRADRRAQRSGALPAADRVAVFRHRAAGQPAPAEFRNVRIARESRTASRAGGGRHDRQRVGASRSRCRGCALPRAMRPARKSTAGPCSPSARCSSPGETMSFRSRLVSPPKDVRDVMVRFFTAADATGAK